VSPRWRSGGAGWALYAVVEALPFLAPVAAYVAAYELFRLVTGLGRPGPGAGTLLLAVELWAVVLLGVVVQETGLFLLRSWRARTDPALQPPGLSFPAGPGADHRRSRPLARWIRCLGPGLDPLRVSGILVVAVGWAALMAAFIPFKEVIPTVHPFALDAELARWDRWVFLGHDPWRVLQPLLGHPWVTVFLDRLYSMWYFVGIGTLLWHFATSDRRLRSRFLLASALVWILIGTIAAILLSSAGPIYFQRITGDPGPYAPLFAYLHRVDAHHTLAALKIQEYLWQGYAGPRHYPIDGISAMPSMHVSIAVLMTLMGFQRRRWIGWLYAAFALLVLVASVHLGWHYAVDGLVAAGLTWMCWWAAGDWTRRFDRALRRTPRRDSWRARLRLPERHREAWPMLVSGGA
jgi:hypothetical protein